MNSKEIFLKSIRQEKTPRSAVGSATSVITTDLMDKIGISFPDAHLDAKMMAGLAAAGHEVLGFDNVMPLFSVWHESAALGCEVNWGSKNLMPASQHHLYNKVGADIDIPRDFLQTEFCAVPLKAISLLKKRLGNDVAVVGKVFGPWTLGYHVFGIENFLIASLTEQDAVKKAMRKLVLVTIDFAKAQIEAGADVLTLADHCTRDLCSPETYKDFLQEIHQELHESIPCLLILHICGDTSDRLQYIRETGIECFHFDSKVPSSEAKALAGNSIALMGGMDNINIIKNGTPEMIQNDVADKLGNNINIIGPECAVPLDAPCQNLKIIVEEAKRQSADL